MVAPPHGGKLVNRVSSGRRRSRLLSEVEELPKIAVPKEIAVDVENIAYGVFSPLEGFMTQEDYSHVLNDMRLSNDIPWTIPIVLDVEPKAIKSLKEGDEIAITDKNEAPIAIMKIEEAYKWDKKEHAIKVFKTLDVNHPGVAKTMKMKDTLLAGKLELIREVENPFYRYTLRPVETRILFEEKRWRTIVGFQTRNAPHLGHEYVQKAALTFTDGLFINPLVGWKKPGDYKDEVILEAYDALIKHYYPKNAVVLAVLRTSMRYAGPREAIFHAIVRKNFGCTHFIVGRDHAGVGNYYKPYEAQEIFKEFPDLGIIPLFVKEAFYCAKCRGMVSEKICPHPDNYKIRMSGTKIRQIIMKRVKPPPTMMRPEVAEAILKWENPFVTS